MDSAALERAMQLAIEHHSADRLREAEQLYREVLQHNPNHPGALHLLGVIAHRAGRNHDAIQLIRRAIQILPKYPNAHADLGKILCEEGKPELAVACCRRAIEINPCFAPAHNVLGIALKLLDRREEAAAAFKSAVDIDPKYADALTNLADASTDAGDLDEAEQFYRRVLAIRPNDYKAHFELGYVLKEKGLLDDALAEYRAALSVRPSSRTAHSNIIYTMHFHPCMSLTAIREEQQRWFHQHVSHIVPAANDNSCDPERRLKIGYVSPNFRDHAMAYFFVPLIEAHDHQRFEVHCYSDVTQPDDLTARMRKSADVWHDVATVSDEALAQNIRADGIDILVDLTMHMAGERLATFAHRPAPVQVAWLAYPGSTGQPFMDYRITDSVMHPLDSDQAWSSERAIRLPNAWCCYDPLSPLPALVPPPALANGYVTFGSLNNFCKANDETLELWAQLLREVENSRLILMCPQGAARQRVQNFFAAHDINTSRIDFVYYLPRHAYMRMHQQIDIALDPFPCNGMTTTCDALVMCVPVLTMTSDRPIGRGCATMLLAAGLGDWVTHSPEQFIRLAKERAANPEHLAELRQNLRGQVQLSPLMDAPRFVRNIETSYRQMWRDWCAVQRP